mmetsp:Transcript_7372/g.16826  ORF Transcript_7372/g.16826 Transcript_7372/m.16826 type:complete len:257 (-) Transcript_7372:147-917(-)
MNWVNHAHLDLALDAAAARGSIPESLPPCPPPGYSILAGPPRAPSPWAESVVVVAEPCRLLQRGPRGRAGPVGRLGVHPVVLAPVTDVKGLCRELARLGADGVLEGLAARGQQRGQRPRLRQVDLGHGGSGRNPGEPVPAQQQHLVAGRNWRPRRWQSLLKGRSWALRDELLIRVGAIPRRRAPPEAQPGNLRPDGRVPPLVWRRARSAWVACRLGAHGRVHGSAHGRVHHPARPRAVPRRELLHLQQDLVGELDE